MIRTTAMLAALALLAGCHHRAPNGFVAEDGKAAADRIGCALDGAAAFTPACTVDRIAGADGLELMLLHPDGGFRRLRVTKDGRGVVAADGALPANVSLVGQGMIEVAIGKDRYRLPATVRSMAK